MNRGLVVTVLMASACIGAPAAAQSFSYPDFSSVAGLQINGNAAQSGNKLRLTPAAGGQSGSVFRTNTIALAANASFSTFFSFEILKRGGLAGGADGLTFTVQTAANNVGGGGGGLGYAGINNSMAVEFDTFNNGEVGGSNHVSIDKNGNVSSPVASTGLLIPDFDNGNTWYAWVDYNGVTQGVEVRWSQTAVRPSLSMLGATMDFPSILGNNNVFVGFTAGTGAGWGEHNILSWNFADEFKEGGAGSVPEPATFALMLTGLGLIGVIARRRQRH